ncbi:MAG TPA: AAA family ATPase [Terriglobales bacterium]|nr:AAA family ATPase [Terriglobales bacterium]
MDPGDRLKVLINSSTPIVAVETVEEARVLALVRQTCAELSLPLFEWSIADGLMRSAVAPSRSSATGMRRDQLQAAVNQAVNLGVMESSAQGAGQTIMNTREPAAALAHIETLTLDAVFVLKDFHRHLEDAVVIRRLRDVVQYFAASRRALVLTGPAIKMPPELEKEVEFLDFPLPDRTRLHDIVEETFARVAKSHTLKRNADGAVVEQMAANLCGLTEEEAERAVAQALVTRYALCPEIVTDVLEAKKDILRRTGMLEFVDATVNLSAIGGLENLKRWLGKRRGAFDDAARQFGLEPPRGVIIMGVQGCGKSMCARAIAGDWKLPLTKFDTSAIYDKYIGETEKRIQKLFRVAEQLAPVVLWIDELEKVFAGSGPDSASVDAGVSSRLLGSFLSWMQDRKSPVFVAATCNNVTVLPPELMRKGRFDEIFFVDLPNTAERKAIFSLHLAKRKRNPQDFDLDRLAAAARGYSGAEIEATVQSAMYAAYAAKKPMSTETVLEEIKATVPLSATRAEDVEQLRDWASKRAVPASLADAAGTSAPGR